MESNAEHLKVAVRARPLLRIDQTTESVVYLGESNDIRVSDGGHFLSSSYNKVFGADSSQQQVFEYVSPSIVDTLKGFNCTVFAYGQTGSGKTYTMFGAEWEVNNPAPQVYFGPQETSQDLLNEHPLENPDKYGIIPNSISVLFNSTSEKGFTVYSSFLQIYNERIYDLLQDPKRAKPLKIRESKIQGIFVEGLAEFVVQSEDDCFNLLARGDKNRAVRETRFNHHSSRSHTIFQMLLETDKANKKGLLKKAKLNFCDLAGSEKYDKQNRMAGEHIKEMNEINKSLTTLGKVISALASNDTTHVPYRDSKLTRLLQDSLGINTRTILIATISPNPDYIEETISTLKFADRAKQVMVKVKKNEINATNDQLVLKLQREIQHLKSILNLNRRGGIQELHNQLWILKRENQHLKQMTQQFTIEEVEKLKEENKRLRLELQNKPDTFEPAHSSQTNYEASDPEQTYKTNEHPKAKSEIESHNSDYSGNSLNRFRSPQPRRPCPNCKIMPPCVHFSGPDFYSSPPQNSSRYNSTKSSLTLSAKINRKTTRKQLPIRYRMVNCTVEEGGFTEEIKEKEAQKKEFKQIQARLAKLSQIEEYRKKKFRQELEQLEERKRQEEEEHKKRRAFEAKRRREIMEKKQQVSLHKDLKRQAEIEKQIQNRQFLQEKEQKRKQRNEVLKKKISEYKTDQF